MKNIKLPDYLKQEDPELNEILDNFINEDVNKTVKLDNKSLFLSNLSYLLGCQGKEEFKILLPQALNDVLSPIEVREVVYQACAYLGLGRVLDFINIMNEVFTDLGFELPLNSTKTINSENRREKGTQAQIDIFGEGMKDFYKSGPEESKHINYWLAANCFGDYYTREGLDLNQRELITFCFLAAQGGCEPQLTSHAAANMRIGNTKEFLIQIISANIPYIGYPRSLNALTCVNNAAKN